MDKIKEKPQVTSSIREKVKAAPKELVHRGLEDGADRLRTQLRDAAQQGRRDDYGGDQIEDAAAGGMRRMERGAEKAHQGETKKPYRPQRQPRGFRRWGSRAGGPHTGAGKPCQRRSGRPAGGIGRKKPGSGSRPRTHTCALKRKRRFPACHQSAPRASSPSSGSADGRRRRDPRRTEPSGYGSRQAAGKSLCNL